MKVLIFILSMVVVIQAQSFDKFECVNESILDEPLVLVHDGDQWWFQSSTGQCLGEFVEYQPTSQNYQGWMKLSSSVQSKDCSSVGFGLFHQERLLHWVLLSPPVLAGQKGFVQIAFENLSDYGPDAIKSFLLCRKSI